MSFKLFAALIVANVMAGLILYAIFYHLPKQVAFPAGRRKIGFGRDDEKD